MLKATTKRFTERVSVKGKRHKKTFPTLAQALKWKDDMMAERELLKAGGGHAFGGITFLDLCDEYMKTRIGTKTGTKETYKSVIRTHLGPALGKTKVKALKKAHGVAIITQMENDKKSPSTINKVLIILKCIAGFAVDNEYLVTNPFSSIKTMKIDSRKFRYWDEEEAQYFLSRVKGHHLFLLFKFALNTGLRRGEICGLQWKNVKKIEGATELHFNEQLLPGRVRELVKGHSSRFLPLTAEAISILGQLGGGEPSEYIFKIINGKSVEPNYLTTAFKDAQKDIGIKEEDLMKFHGTRHSFASMLSARGINIQQVQHLLGHKDSKVTERYMHLSQDTLRKTVQTVNFSEEKVVL